ncbi:hypothetical protein SCA6_012604 [Theobroma cacao]
MVEQGKRDSPPRAPDFHHHAGSRFLEFGDIGSSTVEFFLSRGEEDLGPRVSTALMLSWTSKGRNST